MNANFSETASATSSVTAAADGGWYELQCSSVTNAEGDTTSTNANQVRNRELLQVGIEPFHYLFHPLLL